MQCPACNASLSDDLRYCVQCGQSLDEATVVHEKTVAPPQGSSMTKNQKIALGCGGGGCLLLIVAAVIVAAVYVVYQQKPTGSNANQNTNSSLNQNANGNSNSNTANSNDSSSSTTFTDGQHRLFQAASATYDNELIKRVNRKLGLLNADDVPNKNYGEFLKAHIGWIFSNTGWMENIDTREKARAYVNEHIND